MNDSNFVKVVERRIDLIRSVLSSKGKEYGRGDRLCQFKEAAVRRENTPERALTGMSVKHDISVSQIIKDIEASNGKINIDEKYIDEKIGDAINYLILLEALLRERFGYDVKAKKRV